jgi:hypothetical protein
MAMGRDLYEQCPICEGAGSVDHRKFPGQSGRLEPVAGAMFGRFVCPACDGARFVKIGLTADQVERIVAENDRLKALRREAPRSVGGPGGSADPRAPRTPVLPGRRVGASPSSWSPDVAPMRGVD